VGLIVQGAVTRTGDKVRVTAQLIDAKTDTHIWAGTYNAVGASDIIALQSTIATEIAQEVSVHVTADERTRLSAYHPTNPEAYESFLQGRYHLNRRTPRDLALAADFFDRAIELDSTFAPAFAGIADCYAVRAMWNWDTSQNTFPRARHACEAALRADPNLADAYASLAMVQLFYDWDWTSAEKSFRKAIALNPNYAIAYHWYGLALMSLGRYDEAIRRQKQAVDLDPFSPIMLATLGQAYDMNGQYELASECVDRAFDVFPTFGYAALAKSWIAYHQEHYSEAVEYSKKALELKVDRAEVMLVAGLIKQGDQVGAKLALEEGLARGAPYHVRAALYAYYGDMQHAFEMAQLAVEAREWFVVAFRSRWMEPLREHPMFDDLLNNAAAIK
jgi:tetratricopeptide (TPR) repeat protein